MLIGFMGIEKQLDLIPILHKGGSSIMKIFFLFDTITRLFYRLVIIFMILLMPAVSSAATNIVVVMVDDLSKEVYDRLLDGDWLPNLKSEIVDEGLSFQNSFVTNSQCCPSRATFLTGQYSHNHGILSNIGPHPAKGGIDWPKWFSTSEEPGKNQSTIATWLQDAGYFTGYVGKYLNGYGLSAPESVSDPQTYIPPGWSEWYGLIDPTTYKVYNYKINENGIVHNYGDAETDYQTDVLAEKAIGFIQDASENEKPFFLVVSPLAPHLEVINPIEFLTGNDLRDGLAVTVRPAKRHEHLIDGVLENMELPDIHFKQSFNEADVSDKPACPREPPPTEVSVSFEPHCVADAPELRPDPDLPNLNHQYKSILAATLPVDDLIGKIVDELNNINQLSNTVIIFTSDNGYMFGEHRMVGKELAYEESIRIPLVVKGPGINQQDISSKIVLNNDLAPTIADFANVTPPYATDGVSFLPLLTDPEDTDWHRRFFLVERWFLPSLFKFESPTYFALRRIYENQDYIYIASYADQSDLSSRTHSEFYDLNTDPSQINSLPLPEPVNNIFVWMS